MKALSTSSIRTSLSFPIILLIGFVDYLGIGLVYPIFAVLLFDESQPFMPIGSSPEYRGAMLGILIGLTPISQFFCSPFLGVLSDRKGRKIALALGIGVGCLGYLLAIAGIYYRSLALLFLYRILVGASDATAAVAQATISDISNEKNKAKRFAYLNSSLGFGFTIGPFVGGMIADPSIVSWFNCSTPFVAAGLMSLINLMLVLLVFSETKRDIGCIKDNDALEGLRNLKNLQRYLYLKWLFFAGFALSFGWAFFNEFVPVLLRERFNFTIGNIGEYYAYTGACYALGALIATRFVHRFRPESIAIVSLWVSAASMLIFVAVDNSAYIWLAAPVLMIGLACAYPTAITIVSNKASPESQGEVLGIYQSIGAAAMGISPLFVGSAIGAYPPLAAWGGAFCYLLSIIGFIKSKGECYDCI